MYITYEKYKELGGTLQDADFKRLEYQARADINYLTLDRLVDYDAEKSDEIEAVTWCAFELIEDGAIQLKAKANAQNYGGKVASVSNDGYSITFSNDTSAQGNAGTKVVNDERNAIIMKYLSDYTYCGVLMI